MTASRLVFFVGALPSVSVPPARRPAAAPLPEQHHQMVHEVAPSLAQLVVVPVFRRDDDFRRFLADLFQNLVQALLKRYVVYVLPAVPRPAPR